MKSWWKIFYFHLYTQKQDYGIPSWNLISYFANFFLARSRNWRELLVRFFENINCQFNNSLTCQFLNDLSPHYDNSMPMKLKSYSLLSFDWLHAKRHCSEINCSLNNIKLLNQINNNMKSRGGGSREREKVFFYDLPFNNIPSKKYSNSFRNIIHFWVKTYQINTNFQNYYCNYNYCYC
jgi:hypothetical protein